RRVILDPDSLRLGPRAFGVGLVGCRPGSDSALAAFRPLDPAPSDDKEDRNMAMQRMSRRRLLGAATAAAAGAVVGPWVLKAQAQSGPIKIGLVLPYTGVYAVLGES